MIPLARREHSSSLPKKQYTPSGKPSFSGCTGQKTEICTNRIGTNDLGNDAFLTDSQVKNKTIVDYLDCVYSQLDALYKAGGRYFVLLNLAPLQLFPQYAPPERGGLSSTRYYPNKGPNITEVSYRMMEQVALVNDAYTTRTALHAKVTGRYPGANLALFNVYDLVCSKICKFMRSVPWLTDI